MADESKTCASCGHAQSTGLFCEACGTKLPDAAAAPVPPAPVPPAPVAPAPVPPAPAAAPAAAAPPPPPPATAPAYAPQPLYAPAAQPPYAAAPQVSYTDLTGKGFWGKFFDFSFKDFITPGVIKVLFIVVMVVIGLQVIGMIGWGFAMFHAFGVVTLIVAIIWGFVALLFSRVFLELIMVFFNIHDRVKDIAKKE